MTDNVTVPEIDERTKTFFLESGSDQLKKIFQWARARRVAPWALLGAVMLRVSASTPSTVQLPGIIGGRVSLNAFCAFVSRSGGGKGISDKVARLAWPTPIEIRLPGSGEGISEPFVLRGKESEDNERLTAYILSCNEIDTLTGLASRQGSILLAQLKSAWMGEPIGQSNASKATSRHVSEHDYRLCLSVGAQPGHAGVIFGDTSGGSPQRFWWMPTEDPGMPRGGGPDPDPLNTSRPRWKYGPDGVAEVVYGIPEIEKAVVDAHLARQRGQADALDGHALLSRCKVAALLAIMHQRQTVTAADWGLSELVMQVSDEARNAMLEHDRQAARAKIRERAIARAAGEEFYENSRALTVRNSILRMLERDGEQSGSDLRRRLGTREKRDLFDRVVGFLASEGLVLKVPGEHRGDRYRLSGHGDHPGHPKKPQVSDGDQAGHRDHPATVTDLETRRSADLHQPKLSCAKWFDNYVIQLRAAGETTFTSFAVKSAAAAEGYSENLLLQAIAAHPVAVLLERKGGNAVWSITGESTGYQTVLSWFNDWLDTLPANAVEINKPALKQDCEAAGHSWESLRRETVKRCPRIESVKNGRSTVWRIVPAADDEDTA